MEVVKILPIEPLVKRHWLFKHISGLLLNVSYGNLREEIQQVLKITQKVLDGIIMGQ